MRKEELAIIAGPSSLELADKIGAQLKSDVLPVSTQIFSDGECKIKMPNVRGRYCIVVHSLYPPTDRNLIQALMIIKKCDDDRAGYICSVTPYMAYARQDRAFLEGEFSSMSLVAKLFESVGTKQIITLDIHSSKALSYFNIKVSNTSSIPLFANYVKSSMHLHRPLAVSPDMGGKQRVAEFSRILGIESIILDKSRDKYSGDVIIEDNKVNDVVAGRDIVILDDIISTGSSIIKATEILRRKNSGKIYAMCSHALIEESNIHKIKNAGVENIITTNSIPNQFAKIDIAPSLAASISEGISKKIPSDRDGKSRAKHRYIV